MTDTMVTTSEPENSTAAKGAGTIAQVVVCRSTKGVSLKVKTYPVVEEFAKSLGDGDYQDVKLYSGGRYWHPISSKALNIYNYDSKTTKVGLLTVAHSGGPAFTCQFTQPGPLYDTSGVLNISFLRLVGVSVGSGVTFGITGVFEMDFLKRMRDQIGAACRQFYINYMRPVDLSVTISAQDLQL